MHRNSSVQSGELSQNRQVETDSPTLVLLVPATAKPTAATVFILSESAERERHIVPVALVFKTATALYRNYMY